MTDYPEYDGDSQLPWELVKSTLQLLSRACFYLALLLATWHGYIRGELKPVHSSFNPAHWLVFATCLNILSYASAKALRHTTNRHQCVGKVVEMVTNLTAKVMVFSGMVTSVLLWLYVVWLILFGNIKQLGKDDFTYTLCAAFGYTSITYAFLYSPNLLLRF
ncbi:hypothetical protein EON65_27570 [archaeon]|nr:MAG: hypothetical protein EON65_27570 [archaeon]